MQNDRRENIRVSTRLPCKWAVYDHLPSLEDVWDLVMPVSVQGDAASIANQQTALASQRRLQQDISALLPGIRDESVRRTLTLLNQRVNLLAQPTAALQLQEVELSADYIKLDVDDSVPVDCYLGIYLQCPDLDGLVLRGRVTRIRTSPKTGRNTLVIQLSDTSDDDQRRLMRLIYAISRQQAA